jgi:hypothetical protein
MTSDPKAIRAACRAGAFARIAGQAEEPPYGLSRREYAAWRMGYAGTVEITVDDITDEEISALIGGQYDRPNVDYDFAHGFCYAKPSAGQPIDTNIPWPGDPPLRNYLTVQKLQTLEHSFYRDGGQLNDPPPARRDELTAFVEQHQADLEYLAHCRYPETGGYPEDAIRARKVLGLAKRKPRQGKNDPARLKDNGWTPVQGKPGNVWRSYWTNADKPGRVNVFASGGGWKIGLTAPSGAREYWPESFPTPDAARSVVRHRLILEQPNGCLKTQSR